MIINICHNVVVFNSLRLPIRPAAVSHFCLRSAAVTVWCSCVLQQQRREREMRRQQEREQRRREQEEKRRLEELERRRKEEEERRRAEEEKRRADREQVIVT